MKPLSIHSDKIDNKIDHFVSISLATILCMFYKLTIMPNATLMHYGC